MLQINPNSWHYRYIRSAPLYGIVPRNLCPYVRAIAWISLFYLFLAALGAAALFMLFSIFGHWSFPELRSLAIFSGVAYAFSLSWILSMMLSDRWNREKRDAIRRGERLSDYDRAVLKRELKAAQEPSIFRLWLEAAHDRVCPQLTFKKGQSDE